VVVTADCRNIEWFSWWTNYFQWFS